MKISVNLATYTSPGERYALAWALPLALFGALGLVFLMRSVVYNFNQYQKVQRNIDALASKNKAMSDMETSLRKDLDRPAQKAVFQKAHYVNGLIDDRQFSLTELTRRVSKLMPASARLISLGASRPKTDVLVRLSVVARDEEGLEAFIENMEEAPEFTDLNIANQSQAAAKLMPGMVGILCTARYLGSEAK
ncbi:MAG TPA: hypothetical protein VKV95_14495 [Terriglobia bacterium]|nr:hypothetical protein [Terriglobia bacterium]